MASVLGININELNICIDRLLRMKIIKIENSEFIDLNSGYINCTHQNYTNAAKKAYQKQTFQMAVKSIDEVDLDKRSHSGVTMTVDANKIVGAKAMIQRFRRELMDYLEDTEGSEHRKFIHFIENNSTYLVATKNKDTIIK